MGQSEYLDGIKGAMSCLQSRLSMFVYIRNVLVIYIHGILYTGYYSHHGHSMRLSYIFKLYFPRLSYPVYCCSWIHWRRVNNKPTHRCFSVEMLPSIQPMMHVCLVAT